MPVESQPQGDHADDVLLQAVRASISDNNPQKIAVAVSGGGDSMALLHASLRAARLDGVQVSAVTVDHGLRPAAAQEIAHVARFCEKHQISHQILTWARRDGTGNLMAAARDARYRLIAEWAAAQGIATVLLGHTRDDIAENFLIRFARKSGPDGLAAMAKQFARNGITWKRPLLEQSRASLRAYLRHNEVSWVEDPTNEDDAYDRARARKLLVPLGELGISEDIIAHVSSSMRSASDALTHYTQIESRRYVRQEEGDLVLRLGLTGPLPSEIKRRLWQAAITWVNGAAHSPRSAALADAIAGLKTDGITTFGGCLLTRKGDDWRVVREFQAVRDVHCPTTAIWDGRWRIEGPHAAGLEIRALGEGIRDCPDWRATGLPRTSLISSPAIWRDEVLIAAPLAGFTNGWTAQIVADFYSSAFAH